MTSAQVSAAFAHGSLFTAVHGPFSRAQKMSSIRGRREPRPVVKEAVPDKSAPVIDPRTDAQFGAGAVTPAAMQERTDHRAAVVPEEEDGWGQAVASDAVEYGHPWDSEPKSPLGRSPGPTPRPSTARERVRRHSPAPRPLALKKRAGVPPVVFFQSRGLHHIVSPALRAGASLPQCRISPMVAGTSSPRTR